MDLPIIDHEAALRLAGNKADLAATLLTMLVESLPAEISLINQLFNQDELLQLKEKVHKLHGAASYCGVPRLVKALSALESHLKSPIMTDSLAKLHQQLQVEVESLLTAYAAQCA